MKQTEDCRLVMTSSLTMAACNPVKRQREIGSGRGWGSAAVPLRLKVPAV